jgi:hypothetical protein
LQANHPPTLRQSKDINAQYAQQTDAADLANLSNS